MNKIETVTFAGAPRRIMTISGAAGAPLVVVLHSAYTTIEKMTALIDPSKFAPWNVVLPEALPANLPRWIENPNYTSDRTDVEFINYAVHRAGVQMVANMKCVYVVGFSSGSFMITRLMHEPEGALYAGAAQVSGAVLTIYTRPPWTPRGMPMLMINGTADHNVEYKGSLGVQSVPASAVYWARANGFLTNAARQPLPDTTDDGTRVYLDDWSANGKPVVDLYTIDNGGHTWPGSTTNLATGGTVCMDIDATLIARDFFLAA